METSVGVWLVAAIPLEAMTSWAGEVEIRGGTVAEALTEVCGGGGSGLGGGSSIGEGDEVLLSQGWWLGMERKKQRTTVKTPKLGLPSRRSYMEAAEEKSERRVAARGRWQARKMSTEQLASNQIRSEEDK